MSMYICICKYVCLCMHSDHLVLYFMPLLFKSVCHRSFSALDCSLCQSVCNFQVCMTHCALEQIYSHSVVGTGTPVLLDSKPYSKGDFKNHLLICDVNLNHYVESNIRDNSDYWFRGKSFHEYLRHQMVLFNRIGLCKTESCQRG